MNRFFFIMDIRISYSKVGTMIYNKESRDCIVRIGE
nr:MAG TPA: hypothetical protein [Herelleviridae sp.]